jgi:hypothetical protein
VYGIVDRCGGSFGVSDAGSEKSLRMKKDASLVFLVVFQAAFGRQAERIGRQSCRKAPSPLV